MNRFHIIANQNKDPEGTFTEQVRSFLEARGRRCTLGASVPEDTECVITLGGDGTLLRAARNFVHMNVAFLGINIGHLGYLTEGDRESAEEVLEKVVRDEYVLEERIMLSGRILRDGEEVYRDAALNDVTLNRFRTPNMINFALNVNGQPLYKYKADGIIVATPTGSTAYNLSCGGPIVEPTAKLFVVTPIAPHSLNDRSLILSGMDRIEIELLESDRLEEQAEYTVYFDGDTSVIIYPGDKLEIEKAEQVAKIMRLSRRSFLETLRSKMS